MATNEELIWSFLMKKVGCAYGVAGLMGNLYAESGLNPQNLENGYERKLGYNDASYTAAVDNGIYKNFSGDSAGYGIAQWTYHTRKAALLSYAKSKSTSIGDLNMQLNFLWKELTESYSGVVSVLKNAKSVREASDSVLLNFERPSDQSASVKETRAKYGQTFFDKFSRTQKGGEDKMTEAEARRIFVSTAQSYLGYSESSGKHRIIIDIYNSYLPHPRNFKMQYNLPWCATYVSAMGIICGMSSIIPPEVGCPNQIALFQKLGRWCENDAHVPSPGDIIYYDWEDNGQGDNKGVADHVGIVEWCDTAKKQICIIEGNYKDSVGRRYITVNGVNIRGYGLPNFALWAAQHSKEEEEMTYDQFVEYQNRYNAEQAKKAASSWASDAAKNAILSGLFLDGNGDGMLDNPHSPVTREQLALILDRAGLLAAQDRFIARFDQLPDWAKAPIRELLDRETINGGTSKDVDSDDINMFLSDIKAIVAFKRLLDEEREGE